MNQLKSILVVGALIASTLPGMAQRHRLSPHETISTVIDGSRIMVVYGRPYTRKPGTSVDREIWGGLVPYGKVWRMGADEATLLITQKPIDLGGTTVPAGAHTLFMLPEKDGPSKLIVNNQIGQWGLQYDKKQDLTRIDLKKEALATPVHQFTMAIERSSSGGGVLKLMWEGTEYSVPFTVQK